MSTCRARSAGSPRSTRSRLTIRRRGDWGTTLQVGQGAAAGGARRRASATARCGICAGTAPATIRPAASASTTTASGPTARADRASTGVAGDHRRGHDPDRTRDVPDRRDRHGGRTGAGTGLDLLPGRCTTSGPCATWPRGSWPALREIVAHCGSRTTAAARRRTSRWRGSDGPKWTRIVGDGRDVEDVYPLTPLQAGMLFHSLVDGDPTGLRGPGPDPPGRRRRPRPACREAWQQVVDRDAGAADEAGLARASTSRCRWSTRHMRCPSPTTARRRRRRDRAADARPVDLATRPAVADHDRDPGAETRCW